MHPFPSVPVPNPAPVIAWIAQAAPAGGGAPAAEPPTLFSPFLMFVAASFFLFYFLVIAPEKRTRRLEDEKRQQLKKSDRVVTAGGIHGTIAAVSDGDPVVTLKVDNNTRLKVSRSSIAKVLDDEDAEESGDKESG